MSTKVVDALFFVDWMYVRYPSRASWYHPIFWRPLKLKLVQFNSHRKSLQIIKFDPTECSNSFYLYFMYGVIAWGTIDCLRLNNSIFLTAEFSIISELTHSEYSVANAISICLKNEVNSPLSNWCHNSSKSMIVLLPNSTFIFSKWKISASWVF